MSRSMASASAKNTSINHKYQQTTPTIEASLRAGVVIGHRMSQNRAQQEENHHNESPTQLIESPRNKFKSDSNESNRPLQPAKRLLKRKMSDDLVFDETDLEDAEQNNENGSTEEEEATPPTIIMRDLNRRRKSSMMRKQSTPEENSHLNEVVNSTRMDTSDEHDESDQRQNMRFSLTPEINVPNVDLRGSVNTKATTSKRARRNLAQTLESSQSSNERSNRSRSKSKSLNDDETAEVPAERRRREATRNMNDMQAEIEMSLDQDFTVPQQEELNHTHNLSNHRNRNVVRTANEANLDKLEEELRDALRPHIPPPRRSERLRQKRVRKLQEKRILLIDQIDAEGGMRHAPFDVDLRNVDIRRKHKR